MLCIVSCIRRLTVQVLTGAFAKGIAQLRPQVHIELELVATEIDMGEERYFEIVDRAAVVIFRIVELLFPTLLAEVELGLQAEILFRVPAQYQSAVVSLLHLGRYPGTEADG